MEDFGVARDLEVAHIDACLKCNQGDYTETFGPRMIIYCDSCLRQVHVVRVARAPAGPPVASALKGRPQLEDRTQECEEERSGSKIKQSALDGNLWFCSPACKNIHRSLGQLEGGEAPFDLLLESTFSLEVVGTNSSARGAAEVGLQGGMATFSTCFSIPHKESCVLQVARPRPSTSCTAASVRSPAFLPARMSAALVCHC